MAVRASRLRKVVRDRRAFIRRLLVAELLARPGEGPLEPRFASMHAAARARRGRLR